MTLDRIFIFVFFYPIRILFSAIKILFQGGVRKNPGRNFSGRGGVVHVCIEGTFSKKFIEYVLKALFQKNYASFQKIKCVLKSIF